MGKRELLIVAVFAIAGLVAFQFSSPARTGSRRFSLQTLIRDWRQGTTANRASASVTHRGVIAAAATLEELRIANVPHLLVSGEARDDIAFELRVDAMAPDEAAARAAAEGTTLAEDDLGRVLVLHLNAPVFRDSRQTPHLTLHVPSRLAVRIEGASRGVGVDVRRVASVELDGVVGDLALEGISGPISGSHRNGALSVRGAGSIRLTLTDSNAVFTTVSGPVALVSRNGHVRVEAPAGTVDIESAATSIEVVEPKQPVDITGTAEVVVVDAPRDTVAIDVRATPIRLRLETMVAVTALTTAGALRLEIPAGAALVLDASSANGGTIELDGSAVPPAEANRPAHVEKVFGEGGVRIALRNDRGAIVISQGK